MRTVVFAISLLASTFAGYAEGASPSLNAGTITSPEATWQAVSQAYLADDNASVIRLLNQASDGGDPSADVGLGLVYYNGMRGTPKDYLKAAVYFTRAVQRGYDINKARAQGGTPGAPGESGTTYVSLDRWLARELKEGDDNSAVEMGSLQEAYDTASHWTVKTAASIYLSLTQQQDRSAQFMQGYRYANGIGIPADPNQAVVWYTRSANQGYAPAQFNLALLYAAGQGVPRDPDQANVWYSQAAGQGYVPAQYNLALMLAAGVDGKDPAPVRAIPLLQSAATQGYAPAAYTLGLMYANGRGVPEDDALAAGWYSKAAQTGFPPAEYNLALAYFGGHGVSEDPALATLWYTKAAQSGYAEADYNLAVQFAYGHGVPVDRVQAYKWAMLAKAASTEGTTVSKLADSLEHQVKASLKPDDVARAQADAMTMFLAQPAAVR